MDRYANEIENLYKTHGICETIPTPLTSIAQALGYVVKYFLLTAENRHISGVTFYKKKEILINPDEYGRRYSFTLAHELGHILLGHCDDCTDEYDTRDDINNPKQGTRDYDAKEIATELLMPEKEFLAEWDKCHDIVQLAETFEVSIAETKVRLRKLEIQLLNSGKYANTINRLYEAYKIPRVYPVPLDDIVKALRYKVFEFALDEAYKDIAGVIYYKEKKIVIGPLEVGVRFRFTLAHEIGHIVLGHGKDNEKEYDTRAEIEYADPLSEIIAPDRKTKEYDATEFAAELLMPENKFKEIWERSRKNIKELANFFDVPIAVAKVRMQRLGIKYE